MHVERALVRHVVEEEAGHAESPDLIKEEENCHG
jgi:hypothetical protein